MTCLKLDTEYASKVRTNKLLFPFLKKKLLEIYVEVFALFILFEFHIKQEKLFSYNFDGGSKAREDRFQYQNVPKFACLKTKKHYTFKSF